MKLRLAAKARIYRMVKHKEKKAHLNVSDEIKNEWKHGDKNAMADLLCAENFNKDLYKTLRFDVVFAKVQYVQFKFY